MIQGLVLSNMPCNSWFSNKNPINPPTGFQKANGSSLNTDTLSKLDWWLSVNNTFSVLVSRVPYKLFVYVNQDRLRYSPQRSRVSSSWMPQQWLRECWVCKCLPVYYLHSSFTLQLQIASVCTFIASELQKEICSEKASQKWTSWSARPWFPPCRQCLGLLH